MVRSNGNVLNQRIDDLKEVVQSNIDKTDKILDLLMDGKGKISSNREMCKTALNNIENNRKDMKWFIGLSIVIGGSAIGTCFTLIFRLS